MAFPPYSMHYLLASLSFGSAVASSQVPRTVPDAVLRGGTLSFLGHATVGDFIGSTSTISGAIVGARDIAAARGWVEAPVATLVTQNDRRDRDLRGSMEVEKYPTMRLELTGASFVGSFPADADSGTVLLRGALLIHGVTRRIDIAATVVLAGDTIHVKCTFPLALTDYRIGGLTKMFGVLRMHPDIEVRVDLLFVRSTTRTTLSPR